MTATATLAFDRSVRRKDEDGRLHIAWTNISASRVNPYYGREIPNAAQLGLEPDRIYQLYRDPEELAKGAGTFNNIPLLSMHRAVSAGDPQEELVAGSTGTDAEFRAPYLGNSLVIWRQEDIDGIESREKCELSCAYRYDADMTPGEYQGLRYDGVMRNIRGNHVALVPAGRAGPDVMVHDTGEILMPQTALASRKAIMVRGALAAYLRPKLTAGPMIAMDAILAPVTRASWPTAKAVLLAQITAAATPRLAQDAKLDDLPTFLGALDAEEDGEEDKIKAKDEDDETEEERKKREAKEAKDKKARDKAARDAEGETEEERRKREEEKEAADKKAMDAAITAAVTKAQAETRTSVIAHMTAVAEAREAVQPIIGKVPLAMDSAPAIYKLALDHLGVKVDGIPPEAFGPMLKAMPKQGAPSRNLAFDAAPGGGLEQRFPALGRIQLAA